jgi:hypothetical protein
MCLSGMICETLLYLDTVYRVINNNANNTNNFFILSAPLIFDVTFWALCNSTKNQSYYKLVAAEEASFLLKLL